MNNQLIEKIITSNNLTCPEFAFENPLLDKNVAKALSKSFVNILSKPEQNSKVNNNLRLSILENLRKTCRIEPENHIKIDENVTALMLQAYEKKYHNAKNEVANTTDKILDEFLVRNIKDMDVNSRHSPSLTPDVLQALINLNENQLYLKTLYKDIIHWDNTNKKNVYILKGLWTNENIMVDDISVKLKSEIEKLLLDVCYCLLNETNYDVEELFGTNTDVKEIVTKSSVSSSCFQLSCSVLNYLFLMTNFAQCIQAFIQMFIEQVKCNCTRTTISILYPIHLSHIVILLDIDIEKLPTSIQNSYSEETIKYMHALKSKSETEFLMLLSHFPQWFDIIP